MTVPNTGQKINGPGKTTPPGVKSGNSGQSGGKDVGKKPGLRRGAS